MDKRTRARELAMQAACQLDVQGKDSLDFINAFFAENETNPAICQMAAKWVNGLWENLSQCDSLIKQAAIKWELSRISMVDKSILRLSVYQLKYCPDIPAKVVINEAIEIAKKFSSLQAPGFVNGVLDAILKKLENDQKENQDG
ncbi:MAG: transcription antitermination factor NusB [Planctomycetes bacterium]|nr:transcription antitermination factor NusB [Planctomycetota bacterium]MBL7106918.1 transcription antitermination factor NusB [Phycisphaerae bacterium]